MPTPSLLFERDPISTEDKLVFRISSETLQRLREYQQCLDKMKELGVCVDYKKLEELRLKTLISETCPSFSVTLKPTRWAILKRKS